MNAFYVTGTDTGAGKTFASAVLLHALRARGLSAVGMKPVASGCERTPEGWHNEDALALQRASSIAVPYAMVNPFALPAATAPQLAAREAGVRVDLAPIVYAFRELAARADTVVVEGVGGWLAPLADDLEQADVARALALPAVLVVGLRLGCLNHARLTARALESDGIRLLGWIGNQAEPLFDRADGYLALLRAALPVPCLGVLPHAPAADARSLAPRLELAPLLSR